MADLDDPTTANEYYMSHHLAEAVNSDGISKHDLSIVTTQSSVNVLHQDPATDESRASTTVFNTPELLEQILMHLSSLALLGSAQLVSKCYRRTIDGSLPLRRKMFLDPDFSALTLWSPFLFWACKLFYHISGGHGVKKGCHFSIRTSDYCEMRSLRGLSNLLLVQPPMKEVSIYVCYRLKGKGQQVREKPYNTALIRCSNEKCVMLLEVLDELDKMHLGDAKRTGILDW